jgi:hypothetical protein
MNPQSMHGGEQPMERALLDLEERRSGEPSPRER